MTKIGELRTEKSIETAIKEIIKWLMLIGVNVFDIDIQYNARSNVAVLRIKYKDRDYEFRSINQKNCRLNMWGIARVMEFKVRAQLMKIEDFGASMEHYKLLEGGIGSQESVNELNYIKLGISPLASNDEIRKKYRQLMKSFHPDMALSTEAKKEFEKRAAEINQAYAEIKKERGME